MRLVGIFAHQPTSNGLGLNGLRKTLTARVAQSRRSEPFGVARAACFEQLAGVFASCGALH